MRLGAVLAEGQEAIDHRSQIALTVEDRLVNDELNCGLMFTFLDASHPQVQFGDVSFASFTGLGEKTNAHRDVLLVCAEYLPAC